MTEPVLLPPDHPQSPKYWMYETGGKLVPAIQRYLQDEDAEPDDVILIRAYLRQWIDAPVWEDGNNPEMRAELDGLRKTARELHNRNDIASWIERALELGIDPL